MTLYEISSDYQALLELGDSADPDDQQAFNDTLEGIVGALELKADDYAVVIGEFGAQSDKIKAEIDRLTAIKKTIDGSAARMKQRLLEVMTQMDCPEIKTGLHTFKIAKNGGKQKLDVHGDVPDAYQKIVYEPDTEKIRAALEEGKELPFACLMERGTHLVIR
ncbi:MAG: siphovirus Gp157 family protein [Lachnospiraceae bacterium]|nr:siphovirus Gp157 family protein [Lachnospiraceae bacterium]